MRKPKSTISTYNELLLIKGELKADIKHQEELFNNDILLAGNMVNTIKLSFSKNKKDNKLLKNSLIVLLNDLFVGLLKPYAKNKKQKHIYIPLLSSVLSIIMANKMNMKLFKKAKA